MKFNDKIAVVGATGAVGEVMLSILADRGHKAENVTPLASERSVGKEVEFGDGRLVAENLAEFDFSGIDYALFSAGGSVSEKYAPVAAAAGAIVIDNTSAFRYDDDIPLVVPEVNPHKLEGLGPGAIIANPNCSTIQMLVALAPIQREVGIDRINVATYQSVSGAGAAALRELAEQTVERLSFKEPTLNKFAQPIAFNVLPQIDSMLPNPMTRPAVASRPNSAFIRRRTKAGPMGGAWLCNWASSRAYSFGSASGIVERSWATFMIGPLRPPSAKARSRADLLRSCSMPSIRCPAYRAATAPTFVPTLA